MTNFWIRGNKTQSGDAVEMKVKDKSHFLDYFGLFVLTELLVGKMPITKGKLTRVLGYAGLHIGPKSDGVVSLGRGHQVSWFAASVNVRNWAKYFSPSGISDDHPPKAA